MVQQNGPHKLRKIITNLQRQLKITQVEIQQFYRMPFNVQFFWHSNEITGY